MCPYVGSKQNFLILIPCSKRKISPGQANYQSSVSNVQKPSSDIPAINELREELLKLIKATSKLANREENINGVLNQSSPSVKAIDLYDGNFHRKVNDRLRSLKFKDCVLIVSALYGLVKLDDYLKLYNLEIKDELESTNKDKNRVYKFWKNSSLNDILYNYIESNNISTLWSLLPIDYHNVFHKLWNDLRRRDIRCFHILIQNGGNATNYKRADWLNSFLDNGYISKIDGFEFSKDAC